MGDQFLYHSLCKKHHYFQITALKKKIAFFDFDGTITRKDTMLEMIRFAKGNGSYYAGLLQLSPWLIAMKAGMITNESAKEKMLSLFFKGMPLKEFDAICVSFTQNIIPLLIRDDAKKALQFHKKENHEIVVVTASAENWVKPWCDQQSLKIIGTRLATDQHQLLTGKLLSVNCNGDEKVHRIKSVYDLSAYDEIYGYGDSEGDKQMLSLATHAFYRHFKD